MTAFNVPKWVARPLIWAFVLGFVGLVCGSMGQSLLLAEMGTAAPLIGIIIAPIGFVVGALLGGLSVLIHLNTKQNLLFLATAVVVGSIGTLYLTVSEYRETIRLVDAEIVACEPVDKLLASQTKMWSESPANLDKRLRPNWEQDIPGMVRAHPGVVLTIQLFQDAWVREQQWRWGGVSQRVDDWHSVNETEQVFAAITDPMPLSPCERFTIGERRFSALVWEKSNDSPPDTLSRFLWLGVLQRVPPEYIRYIPKPK